MSDPDLSSCRVLLVDDLRSNLDSLVAALRGQHQLSIAIDGEAALRSIARAPPDLVLLDLLMPGLDGYQVCKRLREESATRELPIIFVSVLGDAANKARGFEAGGSDYITKPFDTAEVRARVRALLRRKREQDRVREGLAVEMRWLAAIVEASPDAIISTDLAGLVTSWNPGAARVYGYTAGEALGRHIALVEPPEQESSLRGLLQRVQHGEPVQDLEAEHVRKDGARLQVSLTLALIRGADGAACGVSGVARDLTARREAEAALRHSEEQLRQAQKMEAVGRLTSGIVHDFNNLLTVILSYAELALAELPAGEAAGNALREIGFAGNRAATLTRQLLLFSRQGAFAPRLLDLNQILAGLDPMLSRIVGADIELARLSTADLGRISAPRGGIEQVIMNLIVNARDAMPGGGKVTVETANVTLDEAYARAHPGVSAGPYVMLAVSDTGTGMDPATRARIFEPFFTTKEAGRGTGLGLATVLGIVEQAGGSIEVVSEPGRGSTFHIYLPRQDGSLEQDPGRAEMPEALGGSETVLLVESEEQVRTVAHCILRRLGYRVIDARNAGEALLFSEQGGRIDLLLTDVVMPQVSGPELTQRLANERPEMRVLWMSSWADPHQQSGPGVACLQKPFTPAMLARKVRDVLGPPTGATP